MKGKVLNYDELAGVSVISGEDGHRYDFAKADLSGATATARAGQDVDFQVTDGRATGIYVTGGTASAGVDQAINDIGNSLNSGEKSRVVAGILAILLGALGIHKFYLGNTMPAIIMLAVTLVGSIAFGLGPMIMGVVGLIEGIIYLTKTDADFQATYVVGKKQWF